MSNTQDNTQSIYPFGIDQYDRYIDPDISSQQLINQYYQLFDNGKLTEASNLLNNNPKLKRMIVNAESLNKPIDSIIAIEEYLLQLSPPIWAVPTYANEDGMPVLKFTIDSSPTAYFDGMTLNFIYNYGGSASHVNINELGRKFVYWGAEHQTPEGTDKVTFVNGYSVKVKIANMLGL